jgi:hypothetical protein
VLVVIVAVPLVLIVPLPAEVEPIGSVDEVYMAYVRESAEVLVIVIDILGLLGDAVEPPPFVITILETFGVGLVAVPVVVPTAEFKDAAVVVFLVLDALTVALPPADNPVTVNVHVDPLVGSVAIVNVPVFIEVVYVNAVSKLFIDPVKPVDVEVFVPNVGVTAAFIVLDVIAPPTPLLNP